jgi:thiol-disulfide isomerase/thioredoxin
VNRGVLAAVVVGAACAGAVAYVLIGRGSSPAPEAPAPAAATAAPEAAAPAPTLVATLPDVRLQDRAGQLRSLRDDWRGRSLVINFWATWCAPCRREIPLLQQLAREHAAQGVEVIGIAVDFRDKVLAYAQEMGIEYPLLIGEQDALDAASAFGVEAVGFPFTIFTDAQGRVVAAHMGELHAAQARLILDAVEAVNAGRQAPDEARRQIEAGLAALESSSDGKSAGQG